VAAIRGAQLGLSVAVVEDDRPGGVCLNWGCIPSKAMIAASALVEHIAAAGTMGITAQGVTVDMGKMKLWKDGIVKRLTGGIGELFKRNGVEHLFGDASFVAADRLRVKTKDGEVLEITEAALNKNVTELVESGVKLPWWWMLGEPLPRHRQGLRAHGMLR